MSSANTVPCSSLRAGAPFPESHRHLGPTQQVLLPKHADPHEPDDLTTAKKLSGKYSALERDAGITVRCDDCAEEPMAPDRFVAALPRPWADSNRLQCQECWAREAAGETSLEDGEARVLAAKYAGFAVPEITSAHGGRESDVQEILAELNERARQPSNDTLIGQLLAEMLGR
jgi:hypothetical protein